MASATQRAPETFGRYLLDEEIARGGMARVYRARLRGLAGFEKTLVVKQIRPELASDPRFVELFVAEANTLVSLSHPNIVPVYELGVVDGVYFLAMEHVEGCTLSELLGGGPLDAVEAADVGAQVLDALGYAHERGGIVHRDVTPRNVLVDAMGHARLVDFGVAARVYANGTDVFGSAGYMAPEQARGAVVSPRSDLFSASAVIVELMTGRPVFFRSSPEESLRATLEEPLPDLTNDRDVPEELAGLLGAALARDPEKRPHGAHEMARKLRTYVATHAPEGVASRLAERVSFALASRRDADVEDGMSTNEAATRDGKTMSIAASRVLTAALTEEGTAPVSTTNVTTDDIVAAAGTPTVRPTRGARRGGGGSASSSGGYAAAPSSGNEPLDGTEGHTPSSPEIPRAPAVPASEIETLPQHDRPQDPSDRPAPATAPLPGRRPAAITPPTPALPEVVTSTGRARALDAATAAAVVAVAASPSPADPRPSITSTEPPAPRRGITPWMALAAGLVLAIPLAIAFRVIGPGTSVDGVETDPRTSSAADAAITAPSNERDAATFVASPATPDDAGAITVATDSAIPSSASSDAALPVEPRDAGAREPAVARGTVEIAALPWADVRIDGRSVGTAPIRGRSVSAGSHEIRASCPPLGANARVRVQVPANGRVRVSFDLRHDPPVVRVR